MTEFSAAELSAISAQFETATPQEILRWAIEQYCAPGEAPRLTMGTAFGAEGCCLIDMIACIRDEIGVAPDLFNLDTGYQFPQTLALRERMEKKYDIHVRLVRAEETVAEMEARLEGPIYRTNPDHCCYLRKIVPLETAVEGFDAWISAIRRDQTPERAAKPIIGPDPKFDFLTKINPLANWSRQQVWDYIRDHDVPTNPLHEQGFLSIGCWPCTRPVAEGEDERAGRWAGMEKRECGLHLGANSANGSNDGQPIRIHTDAED